MKIHITDIEWKIYDEIICIAPPVDIVDDIPDITDDMTNDEKDEAVANWLSDTYGWGVNGFQYTIITEDKQ